ncbi:MAG TPA: S8 family serine peptidase, partial [Pyrinomonadaceae bacterium]|nr:S8 family serine peptidase [Pyrinomonadaceae bacterium]
MLPAQNRSDRPRSFTVQLSITLLLLLLVSSSNQLVAEAQDNNRSQEDRTSASDMVVIETDADTTLYLLDRVKKKIYQKRLSGPVPERLNFKEFELVAGLETLSDPAALTKSGSNLIVFDRSSQSVYKFDTRTSNLEKLIEQTGVTSPASVAVSRGGAIAVSEDEGQVAIFQRAGDPATAFTKRFVDSSIPRAARLVFAQNNLLGLDSQGKIFQVDPKPGTEDFTTSKAVVENIRKTLTTVQDLTYLNGVFYAASEGKIVAFTPISSHKSFPIFQEKEPAGRSRSTRITASREYLFFEDQDRQALVVVPRPVPITMVFEPAVNEQTLAENYEQQREALVFLYEYLSERKMLPTREFVTTRRYKNLKQLLFEEGVLIGADTSNTTAPGKAKSDSRLTALLCKYNRQLCSGAEGALLGRPVADEQTLVLPNLPREHDFARIYIPTEGKTVREVLDQVLIPEHRAQITAEYLLKTNSSYKEAGLQVELAKSNFIPSSEIGLPLNPGKFIKFENGREVVVGDLAACNPDFLKRISRVNSDVPEPVRLAKATVPWKTGEGINREELAQRLDINHTVIEFKDWQVESTDLRSVEAMLNTSDSGCGLRDPTQEKLFLVQQAVKTTGARFKFFSKANSTTPIKWPGSESKYLLGRVDEDRQYSLVVDEPLYLGYTLLKVDPKKPANEWTRVSSKDVNADSKNEIFNATGAFTLPATRWRISAFANAVDVYNSESELNKMRRVPGVTVLKEERFDTHTASAVTDVDTLSAESEKAIIQKNRRELLKKLRPFPPSPRLNQVRVGVAEPKSSIHIDHPDIAGMWQKKRGALDLEPIVIETPASVSTNTPLIKKFVKSKDHGDHVVGLLAARGDVAPGLAPGVQLFLIDTTNQESEASLEKDITDAIVRDVKIFNMSFTIGDSTAPAYHASLDNLKYIMRTSDAWRNALFITAAGNEGQNLGDLTDRALVKWVVDVPNIIGVAAADENNNVLGQFENDEEPP